MSETLRERLLRAARLFVEMDEWMHATDGDLDDLLRIRQDLILLGIPGELIAQGIVAAHDDCPPDASCRAEWDREPTV